jgi:hypothetical protein
MANNDPGGSSATATEQERLELERLKVRLEFWKYIIVSGFVAIAVALIPPLFQLATAVLEYVKSQAQLQTDKQNKEADRLARIMHEA